MSPVIVEVNGNEEGNTETVEAKGQLTHSRQRDGHVLVLCRSDNSGREF